MINLHFLIKYRTGPGSNSRPLDLQSDSHLLPDMLLTAQRCPVSPRKYIGQLMRFWFCLFVLILYVLVNNFSVMSVQVFLRKQHSDSTNKILKMIASVVVGHRLEIIIDHRLESVAAVDAIF